MTAAFAKLSSLLQEQGTLTNAAIRAVEAELGPMTAAERLWLSLDQHELLRRAGATITVEEFVEATHLLETSLPGSLEYERACQLIEAFENAA
jgi:hypothetical protein